MLKGKCDPEDRETPGSGVAFLHLYLLRIYTRPFHFVCLTIKQRESCRVLSSGIIKIKLSNRFFF